ncbi:FUSC family protein [Nocardia coubleae]|uniref:FUSC family protein n=1 Tax=Nocardia coubleae TaxID=356147 RepID=A0A846W268_9NOCA|nr:FUSC family protein [Nocardia coubleae]NKX87115.1 FUSC family protein [Nocardia coubleae]
MLNQARPVFRRFVTEIDHLPAARVFVGLAIPGLMLVAAGRTDLLIYAVFGSFTGMYGFAEAPRQRLAHQCEAAVMLVGAVGAGILLGRLHAPPAVLVAAVAVFAAVASPVTDRLGLRPEGPFFGIFAFGAIAMVADTQRHPVTALLVCAGTAILCVAVGYLESTRRVRRGTATDVPSRCPPHRHGIDSTTQAGRYALAISLSGGIGLLLGVGHANWAMAGAAVPLAAATSRDRLTRGMHRVIGTFLGLLVATPLLIPGPSPAVLGLAIIALLYPTELFMARHYALALGFFTPLIMAMTELADPTDPLTMLTERGLDTVIGVAVGLAVALLIRDPAPHTVVMGPYPDKAPAEHAREIAHARHATAAVRDDD